MEYPVKIERNKDYGYVVSSRVIAKELGKRHDNVIRDIENLLNDKENLENSDLSSLKNSVIFENYYRVSNQKRTYKEYLLTKDGFTLYMFNIQGHNVFKIAYITTFNKMEEALRNQTYQQKQIKLFIPDKKSGYITYKGEPVITLPALSSILHVYRQAIANALEDKRIIAGNEMKAFKDENEISKYVSCVTIFNKEEVDEICDKLEIEEGKRKIIEKYFIPDCNVIRNSRTWKTFKDISEQNTESVKRYLKLVDTISKAVEELEELKVSLMLNCSYSKSMIDEFES